MHSYKIELRIVGGELDPETVTRALGLSPSQIRRKGEKRGASSTWTKNMWAFDVLPRSGHDWPQLEDGLTVLVEKFNPVRAKIHSFADSNEVYIWCGHFTSSFDGGPTLSPVVLSALANFGVQLMLDTYCQVGT